MSVNNIWCEEELQAAYYLSNMAGVGNISIFRLLEDAGSARRIMHMPKERVYELLDKRTAGAFLEGRKKNQNMISPTQLQKEKGIGFIPFTSPKYPKRLINIPNPPFALYVKGRLPAEHRPTVAIVGARACSEYGKSMAEYFGRRLGNAGIQVISGMARGIDGIAQRGAIAGGGDTYAVMGCGVDICYPEENRDLYRDIPIQGGIISEYLPGTKAKSSLFPPRNRIISGLADVLLVIEARKRSGTYITVMQALEQGKEVYALPGRVTDVLSEGCNYLLSQGAGVAVSPESILEVLSDKNYVNCNRDNKQGFSGEEPEAAQRSIAEERVADTLNQAILSCLDINPVNIEDIYIRLKDSYQIDISELLLELTKLQIKGKVKGEGNYYRLTSAL